MLQRLTNSWCVITFSLSPLFSFPTESVYVHVSWLKKNKKSSNSNAHSLLNKLECVGVQPVVLPQSHFTENTHFWVWTQNWEQRISIIMPELWSSSTLHTQQTHQLQITQLEKKECWKQRRSMSDVDFNSDLMICVCLCLLSSKNTRVSDTVHYTAPKVGTSHCLTSHKLVSVLNFEFRVLNES